jgi:sulfur-oxidizing protein SoxX
VRPGSEGIAVLIFFCALAGCSSHPTALSPSYDVQGDAITQPLAAAPGDAARGREIATGRDANCLFCHAIPGTVERFAGNIGPPLAGVGGRLTAGQLRLRIADPTRLNRGAVMPAYHKIEGLDQVALPYRGKPILTAEQIEDVIAYLLTLK